PALRVGLILARGLVEQIARLLQLPHVLLAQLREIGAASAAPALLSFSGLAALAGRLLRAGALRTCRAVLAARRLVDLAAKRVQPVALVLHARQLIVALARFRVLGPARR